MKFLNLHGTLDCRQERVVYSFLWQAGKPPGLPDPSTFYSVGTCQTGFSFLPGLVEGLLFSFMRTNIINSAGELIPPICFARIQKHQKKDATGFYHTHPS